MTRKSIFRYPEDRLPVAIIGAVTCVDVALYFSVAQWWILAAYWALMILPKGKICAWNHHHQHIPTFRPVALNRLLEFCYTLHTGISTNAWVLHHVLGHHLNYLDQAVDESRWTTKAGETMGELRYTLEIATTAYYRAYVVGKSHPRLQRGFLLFSAVTFSVVGVLVWYRPVAGLFLFVLPMVTGLLLTAWATYDHHTGLETQDPMEASYNNLHPFYNLLTGNLGYHTAHHHRQGVHWSKLPALHDEIKAQIPARLVKYSWF